MTLVFSKRLFFTVAGDDKEYLNNIPSALLYALSMNNSLVVKLTEDCEERADIYTFIERGWCFKIEKIGSNWRKEKDNVALLNITTYTDWFKDIDRKTRNMVRKAEKCGVMTKIVEPSKELAEGIWKIYNETLIRQGRPFPHYGMWIEPIEREVLSSKNCDFIGAYSEGELIGFVRLTYGDNIAVMSRLLSLKRCFNMAPNNALIAKAVEVCADKGVKFMMYGRIGNHPSLDKFKIKNGFVKFPLTRYYIPLTMKGRWAIRLKLHRDLKDMVPQFLKYRLFSLYNWCSRVKWKLSH